MGNWEQAKKDLRKSGVRVNVSLSGCCLGCNDQDLFKDDEVAIYQLKNRFSNEVGGYLCHQNVGDSAVAAKVMAALNDNGIKWKWDGSNARSIYVDFEQYV